MSTTQVRWCLLGLLIPLAATLAIAEEEHTPRRYALLIGVNKYSDLKHLEYAASDQWALADQLEAVGFPKDQIFVLSEQTRSGDPNGDVRRLPIQRNIERWLNTLVEMTKKGDVLVVAFSGHGVQVEGRSYLCPIDADPEDPERTMISVKLLNDKLKVSDAKLKLVVLDACRDDPRPPGRRSVQGVVNFDYGLPPDGLITITSCSKGKIAREDEKLGHGVFMHFFLQGLKGEAAGDDGTVTLGRLFDYASHQTDKYVANKWADVQQPVMLPASIEQVALVRSSDRRPVVTSVPLRPEMPNNEPVKPGEVTTNSIGMKLVLIPAGEFLMGSPATEEGRKEDEQQHRVRITKPFWLGVYEVTQEEYEKVMGVNPSTFSSNGVRKDVVRGMDTQRFPVEHVSWNDAVEFCRRLSEQEGREYRLPTEAQWEYACRAGTTTEYYTGNGERSLAEAGWYGALSDPKGNSEKRTNLVGQKRPNAFGLYDMHGNLGEWCSDWYDASYYTNSPIEDPTGPSNGSRRVDRGGSGAVDSVECRSANRNRYSPWSGLAIIGFRVASVPSE